MDYYLEITKKFEAFCNSQPYPDARLTYLESARKIKELYLDAMVAAENTEDDESLAKIYNEMCEIIG